MKSVAPTTICFSDLLELLNLPAPDDVPDCVFVRRMVKPGVLLRSDTIHIVASGLVKIVTIDQQRVIGFGMKGRVIGLEVLGGAQSSSTYVMSYANIIEIPVEIMRGHPGLHAFAVACLSRELNLIHNNSVYNSSHFARQKLAAFVLEMLDLSTGAGGRDGEFNMGECYRNDVASYVGMTMETTSRTLTAFAREGLIEQSGVRNNIVAVKNTGALLRIAKGEEHDLKSAA